MQPLEKIRDYILNSWTTLQRTHRELLAAAEDEKLVGATRWPVIVSERESLGAVGQLLTREIPAQELARLRLLQLGPHRKQEGLLYLPHPYVVPGGRFNEMYGWDSYFILLGLLRDDRVQQALWMVDNFLYEIEHYGKILNANRSYYLTRSQPPFLTEMILAVYQRTQDRYWLESTLPHIQKTYDYWTTGGHLTTTGLSRYFDEGEGPAIEVVQGEKDAEGRGHYERILDFFRTHPVHDYDVSMYYDAENDCLTDLFYVGDRSMRESGFDPSNRFGAFNIDVIHYNPVCLNSLLWRLERETADILTILGKEAEAPVWLERAEQRRKQIDHYLWDAERRTYLDYNFLTGQRRVYPFGTCFFPLWAGHATPEQAAGVERQVGALERDWGLDTSSNVSGNQWDSPFGWAPLQLVAVDGLRRYGFEDDCGRLSLKFLKLVLREFLAHGTIVEKYDVVAGKSQLGDSIKFGYTTNEVGFGWTNGVFLELLAELSEADRAQLQ